MIRSLILLSLLLSAASAEISDLEGGLRGGVLYPASTSTQGVGLYCVHRGETTATLMVLKEGVEGQVLAIIPIRSTYATPKEEKDWLTVKWNASGTMVAIHDSLDKHSKVLIYRRAQDGRFLQVTLPDAVPLEGGKRMGLEVSAITSSGQEPQEWRNDNLLMVDYRFRTKDGAIYRRTLPITVENSGKDQPQ